MHSHLRFKILQAGELVLHQAARAVLPEELGTPQLRWLIECMRETMRDAPGVGLAAPQVGIPLQIAVIEDRAELLATLPPERLADRERRPVPFHVLVNPRLTLSEEKISFFEGCLSVSGFTAIVPRSRVVRVECLDESGQEVSIQAEGWYARILQHEIDHLNGTLYIDRMLARSFMSQENHKRYWDALSISEVIERLEHHPRES